MTDPARSDSPELSGSSEQIFGSVLVGPPLAELRELYEQKRRGLEGASTGVERDRLDRAYELAASAVEKISRQTACPVSPGQNGSAGSDGYASSTTDTELDGDE